MAKLGLVAILIAVALVGCGSSEPAPTPTASEGQAIAQSTATWDQQKLDAFKKAHERAKSGADEDSSGAPSGKK